jgi:hypothetical protein
MKHEEGFFFGNTSRRNLRGTYPWKTRLPRMVPLSRNHLAYPRRTGLRGVIQEARSQGLGRTRAVFHEPTDMPAMQSRVLRLLPGIGAGRRLRSFFLDSRRGA